MLKIIAIGILGTVLAMVLKQVKPELALPVSLATGAIILIMAIPQALELMDGLKTMAGQFGMDGDMLKTVFKTTAMAYISEFGVATCKDAGEASIAKKIELFGKISIFLLCVPIIGQIISVLHGMVQL